MGFVEDLLRGRSDLSFLSYVAVFTAAFLATTVYVARLVSDVNLVQCARSRNARVVVLSCAALAYVAWRVFFR